MQIKKGTEALGTGQPTQAQLEAITARPTIPAIILFIFMFRLIEIY